HVIKHMLICSYSDNIPMKVESFIRALAGSMVLLSVALAQFVSPWWLLLTTFVGLNLLQSSFTGFCPPSVLLRKLGWLDAEGKIHWGGSR
ncbi:MAG TPA: DUF2892 domain-containing protein, partial [Opitutaceae bacterium]|nr:DUF2892 domain-containing protein [Opitutaceae bacterium]